MAKLKHRKRPTPEQLIQQQENSLRVNRRRDELSDWLIEQPERMARKGEFLDKIGSDEDARQLLADDGIFIVFERKRGEWWVQRLADHDLVAEGRFEKEREDSINAEWQPFVKLSGALPRFESAGPESARVFVITHTYIEEKAAKKLGLSLHAVTDAVKAGDLPSFVDPTGTVRIPADAVDAALKDSQRLEAVARHEMISVRHISLVSGLSYTMVKEKLMKSKLSLVNPTWGQVCGRWGLPDDIKEFKAILADRIPLWQAGVSAQKREQSGGTSHGINRSERKRLSQQLYENFPTWENYDRQNQQVTLHLGPTNSGKTYQSIARLVEAGSGWYLAPLRLLAHEVFDTLNKRGAPCNLLTGEESIRVDGAQITAATIEMFNPERSGACVVIDEAQMLTDTQRGWAWTRALMETRSNEVHIIGAPIVQPLVESLADVAGFEISVESYERLTPLEVAPKPWSMATLPARTILVAFSRRMVLALKNELEKVHKRRVSVIYGNLPPEVRLKQAERFATGQTEICVATDAIGMGLNLPADHVCFYETSKFDGVEVRKLTDNEIRQIGGRAGRYGLSENGWVGALNKPDIDLIRRAVSSDIPAIEYARVAPTPESIAILPGELYEKLEKWMALQSIPEKWKEILKPMDLSGQIELAKMLSSRDVQRLGEDAALTLINAPSYRETQQYWQSCAFAIIRGRSMPLPEAPEASINSAADLERHEVAIRCADIYLWLSQRKEFTASGPLADEVRSLRHRLTLDVDGALLRKIDTTRRCRDCGRSLPVGYQFNICQRCFHERRNGYFDY